MSKEKAHRTSYPMGDVNLRINYPFLPHLIINVVHRLDVADERGGYSTLAKEDLQVFLNSSDSECYTPDFYS